MTHTEITLTEGDKLQLQWEKGFKNLSVFQNQQTIAFINDAELLKVGQRVTLSDGRSLTVVLAKHGLETWQGNDDLMSGNRSGSVDFFGRAVTWLFVVGGIQIGVGLFLAAFLSSNIDMVGLAIALVILGLIMVGLGFWAKKSESVVPLYIGCGLGILNIVATLSEGKISGIIISGLMVHALYKGAQTGPLPKSGARVFTENGPLDGDF